MRAKHTPPQPPSTATPILESLARISPTKIPTMTDMLSTNHPTQVSMFLLKKAEYINSIDKKTKARVPTKKIIGLKSFFPKRFITNPKTIKRIAQTYSYLSRNAQIALRETTGHPA